MGKFRHINNQDIPLQLGNSPGADYFGGFSTRYAADGSALYARELSSGRPAYDLDAQVAVHALIDARINDPNAPRTTLSNSYPDVLAHRHDIVCWYAADVRDRMLQQDPAFAVADQPGKFRGWDELSGTEKAFNKTAQAAQDRYYEIRTQGEIAFVDGMLHWQPESATGQTYRQMGIAGFQYLAGSYPEPHRETMLGQLPRWRNIDPDAVASPIGSFRGLGNHFKLQKTDFEHMTTLPLSDREQSFFHEDLNSLREHGAATWQPNPQYPADQAGAMEHGKIVLNYTNQQGHTVNKVLDLDDNRRFTTTVHDAQGQLLERETRTPTGAFEASNLYTPSYAIEKTDAQGKVLASSTLAAGTSGYPNPDSPIFKEALTDLKEKYGVLLQSDNVRVIEKVDSDLNAQQIQSQQLYLDPSHPLYRAPQLHRAVEPDNAQQQATPSVEQEPEQPATKLETQPTTPTEPDVSSKPSSLAPSAADPASTTVTPESSVSDRFEALYQAIKNNDAEAISAVANAYIASEDGQAWLQAGREHNAKVEAEAQQQAQEQAQQEQQQTEENARQQSQRAMRM